MAQPESNPAEERARQLLLQAVTARLHATGFPVQAMADLGTPTGDDLKALVASQPSTAPGGQQTDRPISEMSPVDKLVVAFNRAKIDDTVRARILEVLSPQALAATILTSVGVFVAFQFTPVGWAEDIALGLTAVFVGSALLQAVKHLVQYAGAATATTDAQLTEAGAGFAAACADIAIDTLLLLIIKGKGGTGAAPAASAPMSADMLLAERNGQLVVVAVDSIPTEVAAERGFVASSRSGPPAAGGGRPPGSSSAGGAEPPAAAAAGTAAKEPSLLQLAKAANAAEEIEGDMEVFAHGTTSEVAYEMIETSGGNLSASGGNFGGQLHTVPDPAVARVFAQRTAGRTPGGRPSVVGIALPRKVAEMLKRSGLLRVNPIDNPPPGVAPGAQQWIFQPGALTYLQKYGFFFSIT
jgi:hypothetical protein